MDFYFQKIGKNGIIKKWWLTPFSFLFMKTKKEIINIELGESGSIDVFVGIGTNRAEVIEEIKKGVYRALAFFDSFKDIKFEINFIEVESGQKINFQDLELSFAETEHSRENSVIKVENNNKSVCYSGDGMFTKQAEEVYKDSDLVIQETYLYDEKRIGHACVVDAIKMAEENNIKCLALTHINRNVRQEVIAKNPSSDKVKIIIPKPFDEYNL